MGNQLLGRVSEFVLYSDGISGIWLYHDEGARLDPLLIYSQANGPDYLFLVSFLNA